MIELRSLRLFRFVATCALSSTLLATASAASSLHSASPNANTVTPGFFSTIQPLSHDAMAGVADRKLVRSLDGGASWIDIGPAGAESIVASRFYDAEVAIAVEQTASGEMRTWRTTDGARSWSSSGFAIEGVVGARIELVDASTGWLLAREASSSNFSAARLFRTLDGGQSWEELARPPASGALRFDSVDQGWLLGGADGRTLYQSLDRGESWTRVRVPITASADTSYELALPVLDDSGRYSLAVLETKTMANRFAQRMIEFSIDRNRASAHEIGSRKLVLRSAQSMPARMVGTLSGVVLSGDIAKIENARFNRAKASISIFIEKSSNLLEALENMGVRLLIHHDGECTGKDDCVVEQRILRDSSTLNLSSVASEMNAETVFERARQDGDLVHRSSQKRVVQSTRRGFDACSAPSISALTTWWQSSPYKDLNFYMGGRNRACSQPQLSSSWVSQALSIGWNLMPTWVGYQSPTSICTGCAKFSSNATTARSQGVDEANLAANAAEALGLSKPNVIYYNQEKYNTHTAAEIAFAEGFNTQLKARGYVPAMYVHVTNVASYASISPPPEGVWVARWSGTGGSGPSTIPDPNRITDMSDSIFVNKRIWQHYGEFNATWGGVTINIDANIANGPVVGRDLTAQTISFGALADRDIASGAFDLSATASSGLTVSFVSLTPSVCTVSGVRLTLASTGTCSIRASQAGNATYDAAPSVDRSFQITSNGLLAQTISFAVLPTRYAGARGFDLAATASSGLTVQYQSLTASVCTLSAWRLTIVSTGTCTVRASQAGNAKYAAAPTIDRSFSILAISSCSTSASAGDCDDDGIANGLESANGKNPSIKDNDVLANTTLFIKQQYRDFLRKEADASALSYWQNEFAAGRHTRASMIEYLFGHTEYGGRLAPVARVYLAALDRTPDFQGLVYWMEQTKTRTIADIANSFVSGAEFAAVRGDLNDSAYVAFVYNTTLGRAPTASESNTWTSDLAAQRTTRGAMLAQFTEGTTYVAAVRSKILVIETYVGMLQRRPDQSGFDYWVGRINSGATTQTMITGFLNSAEYRSRFLP